MSTNKQDSGKAQGKTEKTAHKQSEHDVTAGQIGNTTVSDIPKNGEQTGRTHEKKAGKGY